MSESIILVVITSLVVALALVVVGMLGLIAILCRMFLKVDFRKDRLQAEVHDPSLSSASTSDGAPVAAPKPEKQPRVKSKAKRGRRARKRPNTSDASAGARDEASAGPSE
jgi:hypothetical protein